MRTIRIFISSPGDVDEERQKAAQVVGQLRASFSARLNLEVMLWENLPLGAEVSFQEGIDYLMSQKGGIDVAVFILWARLGSPLNSRIRKSDGSEYRSGTEREFDLMLSARQKSADGRPHILVYVRDDLKGFHRLIEGKSITDMEDMLRQRKQTEQFIRESFYDSTGKNYRAFHTFNDPVGFAQRLRAHLREIIHDYVEGADDAPVLWNDEPYRGLAVFDVQHAPVFFGREREIIEIESRLKARSDAGTGFVVLVGASGTGKSSLARAGVAANLVHNNLEDRVHAWRFGVFLPAMAGENLISRFTRMLFHEACLPELAQQTTPEIFEEGLQTRPDLVIKLSLEPTLQTIGGSSGKPAGLFLVIDQLEEILSDARTTSPERDQFWQMLQAMAAIPFIRILATLRSDFFPHFLEEPGFLRIKGADGQIDLGSPGPESIVRIIREPARMSGLHFEVDPVTGETLDALIAAKIQGTVEGLPLLEFALSELYARRSDSNTLTFSAYREIGGVEGAIGKRAEAAFNALDETTQCQFDAVFHTLVTIQDFGERIPSRRRTRLSEVEESAQGLKLANAFVAERFFVADVDHGEPTLFIAHEAILRAWPRLAAWIETNRDRLRVRSRLEQSARDWEEHDRDTSLLLAPGLPLEEARDFLSAGRLHSESSLVQYVRTSLQQAEKKKRRLRHIRRSVAAALCFLSAVSMIAAYFASTQRNLAEQRAAAAERSDHLSQVQEMAARARNLMGDHPVEALGLALRAAEWDRTLRDGRISAPALSSLLYTLEHVRIFDRHTFRHGPAAIAVVPQTPTIIVADRFETTALDASSGQRAPFPRMPAGNVPRSVAANADILLIGTQSGSLLWYDNRTRALIREDPAHDGAVMLVRWLPNENRFLTIGADRKVLRWDGTHAPGQEILDLSECLSGISCVDIDPTRSTVIMSGSPLSGEFRLIAVSWEPNIPRIEFEAPLALSPHAMAVDTRDGSVFGVSSDNVLRHWSLEGRQLAAHNLGTLDTVEVMARHPSDGVTFLGMSDGIIHALDNQGVPVFPVLRGHSSSLRQLAFAAGGLVLVSRSEDGTLFFHDLAGFSAFPPVYLRERPAAIAFAGSPDRLIVGKMSGHLSSVDLRSGTVSRGPFQFESPANHLLAIPGKQHILAAASRSGQVAILHAANLEMQYQTHCGEDLPVAFTLANDGDRVYLATYSAPEKLYSWDYLEERAIKYVRSLSRDLHYTPRDVLNWPAKLFADPEGRFLLSNRGERIPLQTHQPIEPFDLGGNLKVSSKLHTYGGFDYSPKKNLMVIGLQTPDHEHNVGIFTRGSTTPDTVIPVPRGSLRLLRFSPDGEHMVHVSDMGQARYVQVDGAPIGPEFRLFAGTTLPLALSWTPSGNAFALVFRQDSRVLAHGFDAGFWLSLARWRLHGTPFPEGPGDFRADLWTRSFPQVSLPPEQEDRPRPDHHQMLGDAGVSIPMPDGSHVISGIELLLLRMAIESVFGKRDAQRAEFLAAIEGPAPSHAPHFLSRNILLAVSSDEIRGGNEFLLNVYHMISKICGLGIQSTTMMNDLTGFSTSAMSWDQNLKMARVWVQIHTHDHSYGLDLYCLPLRSRTMLFGALGEPAFRDAVNRSLGEIYIPIAEIAEGPWLHDADRFIRTVINPGLMGFARRMDATIEISESTEASEFRVLFTTRSLHPYGHQP